MRRSVRCTLAITRRILFGLLHEPRTLVLIFLAPVLSMVVFGLAFSGEVRHVRVVVVNLDQGVALPPAGELVLSRGILANIDPAVVRLVEAESEAAAVREVEAGRASGVIVFPESFTADMMAHMRSPGSAAPAALVVRLDRTVIDVASAVSRAVQNAMLLSLEAQGEKMAVHLDVGSPIYGANARFLDYFLPGIMGFACFFLTAMLTIVSFVGERRAGTLERLLSTPVREEEIVAGYALIYGVIGVLQSCLLLLVATSFFRITVVGSTALALVAVILLSVAGLSLGMLLSIWARTELQAVQMIPLIVLPALFLSGVLWPLEAIPTWLRPVSYIVPPFYAIEACRSVMGRGWGLERVWPQLTALLGFALAFLIGSSILLRRSRA